MPVLASLALDASTGICHSVGRCSFASGVLEKEDMPFTNFAQHKVDEVSLPGMLGRIAQAPMMEGHFALTVQQGG